MHSLSSLPVLIPFLAGPVLVAVGFFAPRWFNDSLGALSAVAVTAICALLAVNAASHPLRTGWGGGCPSTV